jgi:uncharacterized protein
MLIDITKLKSGYQNYIDIDENYSFTKEELKGTDIISLNDLKVRGILDIRYDDYHIDVVVSGTMILPCAITLEEVKYPFTFKIDENIEEFYQEEEKKYKKCENAIDILPIIWENILMEIPMKVVSENIKDIHLEGDGWKLITDDEVKSNSPFEKLNEILK